MTMVTLKKLIGRTAGTSTNPGTGGVTIPACQAPTTMTPTITTTQGKMGSTSTTSAVEPDKRSLNQFKPHKPEMQLPLLTPPTLIPTVSFLAD